MKRTGEDSLSDVCNLAFFLPSTQSSSSDGICGGLGGGVRAAFLSSFKLIAGTSSLASHGCESKSKNSSMMFGGRLSPQVSGCTPSSGFSTLPDSFANDSTKVGC